MRGFQAFSNKMNILFIPFSSQNVGSALCTANIISVLASVVPSPHSGPWITVHKALVQRVEEPFAAAREALAG